MARIDCIKNVLTKIPGATMDDVKDLYDSMTGELQRAFSDGLGNPKSEYAAAAERALTDHVRMVQNLATEAKENLAKRVTLQNTFKDFGGDKAKALRATAERIMDGHQAATRRTLSESFVRDLDERKNPGILEVFRDGSMDREIYQAVHELAGGKELPGPRTQEVKVIAKAVHNLNKLELHYYQESGAINMNDLQGHVAHQGHDPQMLRSVAPDIDSSMEQWKSDIVPLLDQKKTFERSFFKIDPDKMLDGVFQNIVEEKHEVLQSEASDQFVKIVGTPSNMARRAEMGKKLYFKDGYSQYDYNQMYGKKTLAEQINSTINAVSRNTGMMQELGTNPKATWERMQAGLEGNEKARLGRYMAEMDGSTSFPGNSLVASIGNTSRSIIGMTKLGFALPAHFSTIMNRAARLTFNGENLLSGLSKSITGLYEAASPENRAETMRIHGIGADARLGQIWNELHNGEGLKGTMAKANETFYKLNGMHSFVEGSKIATAQKLGAQFGGQAGKSFSALDPGMARSLMLARIDPVAWDVLRASKEDTERGPVIGSNNVANLPNEVVRGIMEKGNLIPKDAKPAEVKRSVEKYKFATQQKFAAYMSNAIDTDMGMPGVSERADILRRGGLSDSVGAQAWRSVMQFKAFPIAMMTRWGDFALNEILAKESNFDKVGTVTGLAASGLVLGYIGYATNELMHGRAPPDPHSPDVWMKSAARSGVLGYFGDFLIQNMENKGRTAGAADSLLGPTFGQVDDVAKIGQSLYEKNPGAAAKQAYRVGKNNVPGPWNFPITKPAMEKMFLNEIAERMNPGYLRRERTRMKQHGQSSIFGQ